MFSSQVAYALYKNRVPSVMLASSLTASPNARSNLIKVFANHDSNAVSGLSKNAKTTSNISSAHTDQTMFNEKPDFKSSDIFVSKMFKYDQGNIQKAEEMVERVIFNFRFLAFLAVMGSLAGSLLCFLNGCLHVRDAFGIYWTSCCKGIHSGQMVLRLVEAVDVYLAGTVLMIFGIGLYGLFIRDLPVDKPEEDGRALMNSSFFGMFTLKERPKWLRISSLEELKTKLGHVIVMILLVKMFERSKCVTVTSGIDLLSFSMSILLSSASLFVLNYMHK